MLQAVRLLTELARPAAGENNHHNHHHQHHHHHHHSHSHHHSHRQRDGEEAAMDSAQQQQTSTVSVSSSAPASALTGESSVVQFREIYKNGWLRRTDRSDKETNRFWVAFCVHDDAEPRLEGYNDQKQATTHSPVWANSLRTVQHLSPTLCATQRHDYEFCVNFNDDRVLRLAAPTYQGMLDWVQLVTRKLTDMRILRPKENLYSKGPERIATRDPTSPLPPPPLSTPSSTTQPVASALGTSSNSPPASSSSSSSSNSSSSSGSSSSTNSAAGAPTTVSSNGGVVASTSNAVPSNSNTSSPGREAGTSAVDTAPMIFTFDDISLDERRSARPVPTGVQRMAAPPTPSPRIVTVATTSSEETSAGDSGYESIFMASSYSPTADSVRTARDLGNNTADTSNERYAALMEYRSSSAATDPNRPQVPRATNNVVTEPRNAATATNPNIRRQLTLREQQVFQLRREMAHPAGVRLLLGRRDCKDSIAFVDTYGAVWVAGWKQREHPLLYSVLHVGDLVLSVAGVTPLSATAIKDILKGCSTPRVEVIVRRLPYARTVTLTKRNDSDEFGLEVNGNEVSGVSGVALSMGLPQLATATDPTAPAGSNTTWTLTEINGKPLNIFDGGACERFRAVGRDISIVIQPTDLVSSLRKKLRSIRNYKNFVMQ